MGTTTGSNVPATLSDLRQSLIDGGYPPDEAFQIVRDLVQGGHI